MNTKDKLISGPSKKGLFLVKSVYFVEIERKMTIQGESSGDNEMDSIWKNLWDLNVLGKVNIFL